jgi:hypothetical protein
VADVGVDRAPRNQHRDAGANELKKERSARIPIRDLNTNSSDRNNENARATAPIPLTGHATAPGRRRNV